MGRIGSCGIQIKENVVLGDYTTSRIGGPARYFIEVASEEEIKEAISFARERRLPIKVIGGGSNILFPDEGFDGVVLRNCVGEFDYSFRGDECSVIAGGGVLLDDLVQWTILSELQGMECLSWIPGTVGAAPVQNVGAYGQEIADVVESVYVFDLESGDLGIFGKGDCRFGYRTSVFKKECYGRYFIAKVAFRFRRGSKVELGYESLKSFLYSHYGEEDVSLQAVRMAVFELRMKKGMVLLTDESDYGTVGSFFVNPEIDGDKFNCLKEKYRDIPCYIIGEDRYRVSAAWLIERSGFKRGYREGNVGISSYHALALVSYGSTRKELMDLAERIQESVQANFGIKLEFEPDVV